MVTQLCSLLGPLAQEVDPGSVREVPPCGEGAQDGEAGELGVDWSREFYSYFYKLAIFA